MHTHQEDRLHIHSGVMRASNWIETNGRSTWLPRVGWGDKHHADTRMRQEGTAQRPCLSASPRSSNPQVPSKRTVSF